MFAVMTTGGKQYRVEAGSELFIERVTADAGSSITFDRVLLVGDGDEVTVGAPTVEGASVVGTVLGDALGPKLIVFKFKQKATYRRKNGHRQHYTRVRIDEINASGKKVTSAPTSEVAAPVEKPKQARKPAAAKATAKATAAKATAESKATADEAPAAKPKRTRKPAAKAAPPDPEE